MDSGKFAKKRGGSARRWFLRVLFSRVGFEFLLLTVCSRVVVEAHCIKNEKTDLWSAMKRIQRTNCLLLTGTPLQNNLCVFVCFSFVFVLVFLIFFSLISAKRYGLCSNPALSRVLAFSINVFTGGAFRVFLPFVSVGLGMCLSRLLLCVFTSSQHRFSSHITGDPFGLCLFCCYVPFTYVMLFLCRSVFPILVNIAVFALSTLDTSCGPY